MSKNNPQSSRPSCTAHRKDQNSGLGKAVPASSPHLPEGGAKGWGGLSLLCVHRPAPLQPGQVPGVRPLPGPRGPGPGEGTERQETGFSAGGGAQGRGGGIGPEFGEKGLWEGCLRDQDPPTLQSRICASDSPDVRREVGRGHKVSPSPHLCSLHLQAGTAPWRIRLHAPSGPSPLWAPTHPRTPLNPEARLQAWRG